jgi:K+-transporting ATPase ATPase C chain
MLQDIRPAIVSMVLFTLILGLGYPLAITAASRLLFAHQASGSLLTDARGQVVGSSLIAQGFVKPQYLHPRPSAAGAGYDPMNSGGSNLGPLDQKLIDRVKAGADAVRQAEGARDIPADAVTTSGSGLDPDISPAYARLQAPRIAAQRGLALADVQAIIDAHTARPLLGFVGQPAVNVLMVNRALDAHAGMPHPKAP